MSITLSGEMSIVFDIHVLENIIGKDLDILERISLAMQHTGKDICRYDITSKKWYRNNA
jgi:hypothetical protein